MAIVLDGKPYDVPGVETISWLDDPKLVPQATDGRPRTTFARMIMAHTVHGKRGGLMPGGKPSNKAEWYARYQANSTRSVSWDFTVDTDGTVAWSNDPCRRYTWHGHTVNAYAIGFEMVQDPDGTMYAATIEAAVKVIDFLTRFEHPLIAIPRQTPYRNGKPYAGRITRCDSGQNGRRFAGINGHRNVWTKNSVGSFSAVRGPGDPNDHLFVALAAGGYETFDSEAEEDIARWKARQQEVGATADGGYGPATRTKAKEKGYAHGQWVRRPGDEP